MNPWSTQRTHQSYIQETSASARPNAPFHAQSLDQPLADKSDQQTEVRMIFCVLESGSLMGLSFQPLLAQPATGLIRIESSCRLSLIAISVFVAVTRHNETQV
jgi:hypothetical protein